MPNQTTSPAPWEVTDPGDGSGELVIVSRSGTDEAEDIATISVSRPDLHPNARANAQLIAAAPTMHDALVLLDESFRGDSKLAHFVRRTIAPALAKARGGK